MRTSAWCLITAFFLAGAIASPGAGDGYEIILSGRIQDKPAMESPLIRDPEALAEAAAALGVEGPPPGVDFSDGAVVVVIPEQKSEGAIEIANTAASPGGALDVLYSAPLTGPPAPGGKGASYPFLLVKVSRAVTSARLVDTAAAPGVPPDTAIGQTGNYTNVLSGPEIAPIAEYIPLDKGNEWTYAVESPEGSAEVTNRIVSESDGWSVFEKFFGVPGVGIRISPGGGILVASRGGTSTFYPDDVVTEFPAALVKTPAGEFGDVMVVRSPEGLGFSFRDVYARGIGLVSHEQRSDKGEARYSLLRARVAGRDYPAPQPEPKSRAK